jgi:hypothetical protein
VILLVALAFSLVEGRRKHPHPGKLLVHLLPTAAILFSHRYRKTLRALEANIVFNLYDLEVIQS